MWKQAANEHLKKVVQSIQSDESIQTIKIHLMLLENELAAANTFKRIPDGGRPSFLNNEVTAVRKKVEAIADAVENHDKKAALLGAMEAADLLG